MLGKHGFVLFCFVFARIKSPEEKFNILT